MGIALYEHNQQAYDAALSLMSETGKAAVIHPTGTGKSFIGFKLAEQHPDALICWLSPSEYIYKTQIENLKAVADGYAPENIYFMTYAKLMMTNEADVEDIQPDYIVLDEFHRCGAAEWDKGVKRLLEAYSNVPILGLSATNIRYLDNQRDMADELFDGNVASEMTLGEAIVRNILLPPTYITSLYSYQKDLDKYQQKVRKAKNKIIRDTAQKYLDELRRTLTKADGLDVIFDKHIKDRHGKFIVFCANVEHMNEMIEKVPEWFGKIDSNPHIYRVYAEDSNSDKEFAAFKEDESEKLKLLFSIDILNEGIHLDVSGVILLRTTVSPIIYKQQIGRALSASKGKEPIIFDIVNNFQSLYAIGSIEEEIQEFISYYNGIGNSESIISANFHVIDEVMECRRLFDELQDTLSASWDTMFAAASQYYKEHGNLLIASTFKTDNGLSLGRWILSQRRIKNGSIPGVMSESRIQALESIAMVWTNITEYNFERAYEYAKLYYNENGNLDVAHSYTTPDEFALGTWITSIRAYYGRGALPEEKVKRLDKIGMIWDKDSYNFERNIRAAQQFYEENGNLDVAHTYKNSDGLALGTWISFIRMYYKRGTLSEEKVKRLDKIGMIWDKSSYTFERNIRAAQKFYKENGHLDIPDAYKTDDNVELGKWIRRYRIYKSGKPQYALSHENRERLNAIGMIWTVEDSWTEMYNLLANYYVVHGNIDIPHTYVTENNNRLGIWLYKQKKIYQGKIKNKNLTENQIAKLNIFKINWNNRSDGVFNEFLSAAKTFYEEYGHLNVPNRYTFGNNKRLDMWIISQRKRRKKGNLSENQIEQLSEIGFLWEVSAKDTARYIKWEESYEALRDFLKIHGHINVPADYVTSKGIYCKKMGSTSEERI